jgi:hypothetical protein
MTPGDIARVLYEVNRAYCTAIGDSVPPPWEQASLEDIEAWANGVEFHMGVPFEPASLGHENWLELRKAQGWVYGPVTDHERKIHSCLVPFDELPAEQKAKDYIAQAIVLNLMPYINVVHP